MLASSSRPIDATLDAIRWLDRQLADCEGPVARGIVARAIAHLEAALLAHLTGPPRGAA
jgi:hypothetical protein